MRLERVDLDIADHVGDQPLLAVVLADEDNAARHVGVPGEHRVDLGGFDAEAADLDLVVGAAEVLEGAVGAPPAEVAHPVHPAVRRCDEPFRGERRPSGIPPREARPRGVQLAGHADRNRPQCGVQNEHPVVPGRRADRRHAIVVARGDGVRGNDLDLGGAVVVVDPQVRVAAQQRAHVLVEQERFSGLTDVPQCREIRVEPARLVADRPDHHVRHEQPGDPLVGEPAGECHGVAAHVVGGDDEGFAVEECGDDLLDVHVERERGELGGTSAGAAGHGFALPRQHVHHAAPGHLDALRPSGGSRGVDDVGEVVRRDPGVRRGARISAEVAEGVLGDLDGDPGVVADVLDPVGRVRRVERYVRGAGLEDAEQSGDHVDAAADPQADLVIRPDSPRPQVVRQLVGTFVQLTIGERGSGALHRDPVAGGARVQQLGQRGLGDVVAGGVPGVEAVAFVEQVDVADAPTGVLDGRFEQTDPAGRRGLDRRAVEHVGGVLDHRLDARRVLPQLHGQVELGGARADRVRTNVQSGQFELFARGVLQLQHHLEQRRVRHGAGGVEHLDELLERNVLVGVGGEVGFPHAVQEFGERGVAAGVGAQHERVDEEPDEVVECLVGAAGDG
ncbi:hypothetical protein Lesp02_07100 [Lentzea sp. NBRC 105346]|nr:hypothetical protein Lesp02_07100 [Lentzea sp. NBRC 105346]